MTSTTLRPIRRTVVVTGAAVVLLVLAAAVLAWVLVPEAYPEPVTSNGDSAVAATREATRSQAVTTRASVLAALAGLGALVTIAINYRNSWIAHRNAQIAAELLLSPTGPSRLLPADI